MRDREQAILTVGKVLARAFPRKWQRDHVANAVIDAYEALPVVVTDEMVERAASALAKEAGYSPEFVNEPFTWADVIADYKIEARAALVAALGEES